MRDIQIYDINAYYEEQNGWYKQTASGDIPGVRTDTCIVVFSTTDNSTHNIYVYGELEPSNTKYDDMNILMSFHSPRSSGLECTGPDTRRAMAILATPLGAR